MKNKESRIRVATMIVCLAFAIVSSAMADISPDTIGTNGSWGYIEEVVYGEDGNIESATFVDANGEHVISDGYIDADASDFGSVLEKAFDGKLDVKVETDGYGDVKKIAVRHPMPVEENPKGPKGGMGR